jgi:hypothetical protein
MAFPFVQDPVSSIGQWESLFIYRSSYRIPVIGNTRGMHVIAHSHVRSNVSSVALSVLLVITSTLMKNVPFTYAGQLVWALTS